MLRALKYFSIALLFIIAINALVAGGLMIVDPSGSTLGLSPQYLETSPFETFLVPGIILFMVNGVMNVIAGIVTIKEKIYYPYLIMFQGMLLSGWIVVQVRMVHDLNSLHIIMFLIGVFLFLCGWVLSYLKAV